MNKKKNITLIGLGLLGTVGATVSVVAINYNSLFSTSASDCEHTHVEHYEASLAADGKPGHRDHWACCNCHDAFISYNETYGVGTKIGNTVSDRSKIDCYDIKWDSSLITVARQAETITFRKDDSTSGTACGETTDDKIYYNYITDTKTLDVFSSCAIRFKENDRISDDEGFFYGFNNTISISLQNVDTSSVTYFYATFAECTSLITVDISSFDTHKATDIGRMFYNCQNLVTVYASTLFTNSTATYKGSTFYECRKIVGGEGSTYTSTEGMVGGEFARIDRIKSKGLNITTKADTIYYINYDLDGGINNPNNPSSYSTTGSHIILENPSKKYCDFINWTLNGEPITTIEPSLKKDIKLVAHWKYHAYSITYNLNGGTNSPSNPSTYTVEDEITFAAPTKTGYSFVNWTKDGSPTTGISKGSTGNITITANWNINQYQVNVYTNDENKGTVSGGGSFDYGSSITVTATPKTGYKFDGWYSDSTYKTKKSNNASYTFILSAQTTNLYARFIPVSYTITYNLNGGTNSPSNPSTYTVEDEITFAAPTKTGYSFVNWTKDGSPTTGISKGSTGNITITANWNINQYQVNVYTNDENKGTVSGGGSFDYGSSVTVTATPVGEYVFNGWYSDSEYKKLLSTNNSYELRVTSSNTSLYARFWTEAEEKQEENWNKAHGVIPVISEDGKTLTYGLYPQTHVKDSALIAKLEKVAPATDEEYFLYNNEYYVKDTGNPYYYPKGGYNYYSDGTQVTESTCFFKCEPIKWNIVNFNKSSGIYTIDCSNIIYARRFDDNSNTYAKSELSTWLNNDFYNKAFSIKTTSSYIYTGGGFDKAGISYAEDYLTWYTNKNLRKKKVSDFALCNHASMVADDDYNRRNGTGCYWTRTPESSDNNSEKYIDYDGGYSSLISCYVYCTDCGVSPTLTIKI